MKSVVVPNTPNSKNRPKAEKINVVCRIRPLSLKEVKSCTARCVDARTNEVIIKKQIRQQNFRFNQVFGPRSSQNDIFKNCVQPRLQDVCQGYSCTIFAYGQTGTGKTYTLEGTKDNTTTINDQLGKNAGIIPRAMYDLMNMLKHNPASTHRTHVSMLELYNEKLIDLLADSDDIEANSNKMKIYDDSEGSPCVSNLTQTTVKTIEDVFKVLEKGSKRRTTAATKMNANSSRSHCIFQATVQIQMANSDMSTTGRLYLVDLAGSENIGRSGATKVRAKEAGNINKSLLVLGRVIQSLIDCDLRIPYRDSQLTRLLKTSLGGKCKTTMVITVSPSMADYEETLNTLEYGHRAQNIKNKPEITSQRNMQVQVENLQNQLLLQMNKNNGVTISLERKTQLEETELAYNQLFEEKCELEELKETLSISLDKLEEKFNKLSDAFDLQEEELRVEQFMTKSYCDSSDKQFIQAESFIKNGKLLISKINKLVKQRTALSGIVENNAQNALNHKSELDQIILNFVQVIESTRKELDQNKTDLSGFTESKTFSVNSLNANHQKLDTKIKSSVKSLNSNLKNLSKVFANYTIKTINYIISSNNLNKENIKKFSNNHQDNYNNIILPKLEFAKTKKVVYCDNIKQHFVQSRDDFKSNFDANLKFHSTLSENLEKYQNEVTLNEQEYFEKFGGDLNQNISNFQNFQTNLNQTISTHQTLTTQNHSKIKILSKNYQTSTKTSSDAFQKSTFEKYLQQQIIQNKLIDLDHSKYLDFEKSQNEIRMFYRGEYKSKLDDFNQEIIYKRDKFNEASKRFKAQQEKDKENFDVAYNERINLYDIESNKQEKILNDKVSEMLEQIKSISNKIEATKFQYDADRKADKQKHQNLQKQEKQSFDNLIKILNEKLDKLEQDHQTDQNRMYEVFESEFISLNGKFENMVTTTNTNFLKEYLIRIENNNASIEEGKNENVENLTKFLTLGFDENKKFDQTLENNIDEFDKIEVPKFVDGCFEQVRGRMEECENENKILIDRLKNKQTKTKQKRSKLISSNKKLSKTRTTAETKYSKKFTENSKNFETSTQDYKTETLENLTNIDDNMKNNLKSIDEFEVEFYKNVENVEKVFNEDKNNVEKEIEIEEGKVNNDANTISAITSDTIKDLESQVNSLNTQSNKFTDSISNTTNKLISNNEIVQDNKTKVDSETKLFIASIEKLPRLKEVVTPGYDLLFNECVIKSQTRPILHQNYLSEKQIIKQLREEQDKLNELQGDKENDFINESAYMDCLKEDPDSQVGYFQVEHAITSKSSKRTRIPKKSGDDFPLKHVKLDKGV